MAKPASSKRTSSFDTLLDYEQRSLAHVAGRPELNEAPGHWRGVGFRLGQRRLVSSFEEIMEILPLPPVTPVPGAQPWMLGVANIRVNCVVPGAIRTPRQMKLWHTPEEEANILAQQCLKARVDPVHVTAMVLFLASDDARMCTAHNYWVDGGYR